MLQQESVRNVLTERYQPTTPEAAAGLLAALYGVAGGVVRRLSSEADETFAVTAADGRRLTLKIASPAERPEIMAFQNGALLHLEAHAPELPVPRLLPSVTGDVCPAIAFPETTRLVRLMSWLEGTQLCETETTPAQMRALGRALGGLDRALATYRPEMPEIDLIWDLSRASRVRPLLEHVDDGRKRDLAAAAFDGLEATVAPLAAALPRQVIHNDINPYNVLVGEMDGEGITGIIDFGDMVVAARINDLAIALAYHVGKPGGRALVRACLAGFRRELELGQAEQACLGPLVRGRLAMTIAITEWRSALRPDHASYITRNQPAAVAGLERLAGLGPAALRDFFVGDEP